MNKLEKNQNYTNETFEDIKHIDENGVEFWYARELMPILQYSKWENFKKVIKKVMIACENTGISTKNAFLTSGSQQFLEKEKKNLLKIIS